MILISRDMTALIILPLKSGGILIDAHEIDYITDEGEDKACLYMRGNDGPFFVPLSVEAILHSIKDQAFSYKAIDK